MRPARRGAKSKPAYLAIKFIYDARYGVKVAIMWGEAWG